MQATKEGRKIQVTLRVSSFESASLRPVFAMISRKSAFTVVDGLDETCSGRLDGCGIEKTASK